MIKPQAATLLTTLGLALALTACQPTSNDSGKAVAALQTQVAELQAREQIRSLFADYGRTLDNRDFAAFGKLFARDSDYVGGGNMGVVHGPEAIAAALEKVITSNASGANLHFYSNEKIDMHGETASATSRGAFYVQTDKGAPTPLMFATYKDEFVVEVGAWKFKRREVILDIPGPSNEQRAAERTGKPLAVARLDVSGDWIISSSVGGKTPITVYCSLVQHDTALSGNCTPKMDNGQPSELKGAINGTAGDWGYDVVFKGKQNHVDFKADQLSNTAISGMLSLAGTPAPFTAVRK